MTYAVNIAQGGANNVTMRNRIINGAMVISQRNSTSSVTPASGDYTLDRWRYEASQASKFTVQQNAGSVTPPAGFSNYLGATVASAVTIGAGDYFMLEQFIEGFNVADLSWGTSSAKTVTLSFQVYSSLTGTFGGALANSAQNRSYPFTYTVSSANTWTSVSITIAGDTTGTWLTTNGRGIYLNLSLGIGSTYSGTANAWAGANYLSATGATSVVGTNGATFYITGVQLEAGTTATAFEQRLYGTELALCQRYLPAWNGGTGDICNGGAYSATQAWFYYPFIVQPRVAPTGLTAAIGTAPNTFYVYNGTQSSSPITGLVFSIASLNGARLLISGASGLTAGQYTPLLSNASSGLQLLFTGCEL